MNHKGRYFSIVIPVYNVAPYLRECLDSVLAQTFTDWECLCVDDSSTDESGELLDEYAQTDPRFRVWHQKNKGLSAARNKALENVLGDYFCFLDSDDWVAPNWLEVFYQGFRHTNADMVRMRWTPFADEVPLIECSNRYKYSILSWDDDETMEHYLRALTRQCYVPVCSYRSDRFLKERFSQNNICIEDIPYTFSLVDKCRTIAQSEYNGYFYRQRHNSLLHQRPNYHLWVAHLKEIERVVHTCEHELLVRVLLNTTFKNISIGIAYGTRQQQKTIISILKLLMRREGIIMSQDKLYWKCAMWLFIKFNLVWPIKLLRYGFSCKNAIVRLASSR